MFGLVTANLRELSREQRSRYGAVYCGICRQMRLRASNRARFGLSYDMAFLALLLMSLYEPEEERGKRACNLHPIRPRAWVDNPYIAYAADMNVLLCYYKCLDDAGDDGKRTAKAMAKHLQPFLPELKARYPRQSEAVERCLAELSELEKANCSNPDEPAGCFGRLLGELLVFEEDLWASALRQTGIALGRFIYLADAVMDYRRDQRKNRYNPFIAMAAGEDRQRWEQYLVLEMARCTRYYESLPLVQDKAILDNILYSGVWTAYRGQGGRRASREETDV